VWRKWVDRSLVASGGERAGAFAQGSDTGTPKEQERNNGLRASDGLFQSQRQRFMHDEWIELVEVRSKLELGAKGVSCSLHIAIGRS
jgi:hypothetical protein